MKQGKISKYKILEPLENIKKAELHLETTDSIIKTNNKLFGTLSLKNNFFNLDSETLSKNLSNILSNPKNERILGLIKENSKKNNGGFQPMSQLDETFDDKLFNLKTNQEIKNFTNNSVNNIIKTQNFINNQESFKKFLKQIHKEMYTFRNTNENATRAYIYMNILSIVRQIARNKYKKTFLGKEEQQEKEKTKTAA